MFNIHAQQGRIFIFLKEGWENSGGVQAAPLSELFTGVKR
jgi:hypothetical protein